MKHSDGDFWFCVYDTHPHRHNGNTGSLDGQKKKGIRVELE